MLSKKAGNIIAGQSKDIGKVNKREVDRPEERDGTGREEQGGKKENGYLGAHICSRHTYVWSYIQLRFTSCHYIKIMEQYTIKAK